jgi:hypothetical protein
MALWATEQHGLASSRDGSGDVSRQQQKELNPAAIINRIEFGEPWWAGRSGPGRGRSAANNRRWRPAWRAPIRMGRRGASVRIHQLIAVACVGGRDPSTVKVPAPPSAIYLGPELRSSCIRLQTLVP